MSTQIQIGDGWMDMATAVAIGSALVHAQELLSAPAGLEPTNSWAGTAAFDAGALHTCLAHPGLQEWLDAFPPGLLPVKRGGE